ncbi:hypothetical protein DID80_02095 [Candidatus Marinamargulisbacteria bacterium SCGC AAA071-K20]|nr:hypothetical protein DID80_02095 [Candidatus Marinamargulisbacteria bacterium SCGC AAA071-K20]
MQVPPLEIQQGEQLPLRKSEEDKPRVRWGEFVQSNLRATPNDTEIDMEQRLIDIQIEIIEQGGIKGMAAYTKDQADFVQTVLQLALVGGAISSGGLLPIAAATVLSARPLLNTLGFITGKDAEYRALANTPLLQLVESSSFFLGMPGLVKGAITILPRALGSAAGKFGHWFFATVPEEELSGDIEEGGSASSSSSSSSTKNSREEYDKDSKFWESFGSSMGGLTGRTGLLYLENYDKTTLYNLERSLRDGARSLCLNSGGKRVYGGIYDAYNKLGDVGKFGVSALASAASLVIAKAIPCSYVTPSTSSALMAVANVGLTPYTKVTDANNPFSIGTQHSKRRILSTPFDGADATPTNVGCTVSDGLTDSGKSALIDRIRAGNPISGIPGSKTLATVSFSRYQAATFLQTALTDTISNGSYTNDQILQMIINVTTEIDSSLTSVYINGLDACTDESGGSGSGGGGTPSDGLTLEEIFYNLRVDECKQTVGDTNPACTINPGPTPDYEALGQTMLATNQVISEATLAKHRCENVFPDGVTCAVDLTSLSTPAAFTAETNRLTQLVDNRSLPSTQISGLGELATQDDITLAKVTDAGSLAGQNAVAAGSVTGLGGLATKDAITLADVTDAGSLAGQNTVAAGSVTGLGTLAVKDKVDVTTDVISEQHVPFVNVHNSSASAATSPGGRRLQAAGTTGVSSAQINSCNEDHTVGTPQAATCILDATTKPEFNTVKDEVSTVASMSKWAAGAGALAVAAEMIFGIKELSTRQTEMETRQRISSELKDDKEHKKGLTSGLRDSLPAERTALKILMVKEGAGLPVTEEDRVTFHVNKIKELDYEGANELNGYVKGDEFRSILRKYIATADNRAFLTDGPELERCIKNISDMARALSDSFESNSKSGVSLNNKSEQEALKLNLFKLIVENKINLLDTILNSRLNDLSNKVRSIPKMVVAKSFDKDKIDFLKEFFHSDSVDRGHEFNSTNVICGKSKDDSELVRLDPYKLLLFLKGGTADITYQDVVDLMHGFDTHHIRETKRGWYCNDYEGDSDQNKQIFRPDLPAVGEDKVLEALAELGGAITDRIVNPIGRLEERGPLFLSHCDIRVRPMGKSVYGARALADPTERFGYKRSDMLATYKALNQAFTVFTLRQKERIVDEVRELCGLTPNAVEHPPLIIGRDKPLFIDRV